jgi:hypothetical protein
LRVARNTIVLLRYKVRTNESLVETDRINKSAKYLSFSTTSNKLYKSSQLANSHEEACRIIVLQSATKYNCVGFEVFTAATMKKGVFWDVTLCGSCKNRRFGGT